MARLLVIGAVAVLVLTVFAVVDCVLTERVRVRALPRWLWVPLVLVLPVLGPALWFLVGRGPALPPRPVRGPDDDPAFGAPRRALPPARSDDAEWRRLEQELARLDADADDEGDQPEL